MNLSVTTKYTSAASNWKRRITNFIPAIRNAEEEAGKKAVQRAYQLSQGSFSTQALRKLGNPYKIAGSPPFDPAIINRQTGLFAGSWRYMVVPTTDGTELRVFNIAPYSIYMLGTVKMIARPILDAIQQKERESRLQRLRLAVVSAITK